MSQHELESVLHETRVFEPRAGIRRTRARQAGRSRSDARARRGGSRRLLGRSRAPRAHWHKPFTVALDDERAPHYRWFTDGMLNVSYNCLDVHLEERGDKIAIRFEGEPGDTRNLTYRELHARCAASRTRSRRRASARATASSSTCR